MTGPSVVSVARIEPDLARQSWERVRRLVAGGGPGGAFDDLRCFIAMFGHGGGVPDSIERVRRVLAAGTPDRLRPHIAVQAALSSEPSADTPGYAVHELALRARHLRRAGRGHLHATLPLAICAAMQGARKARVTWPQDDEIAARVMTAAAPPKGGVH